MLVLITYDVNTEDASGRKRLRKIARECVNYGQRVQNSVFECSLDAAQLRILKAKLLTLMDSDKDSLRFYNLGSSYKEKIEHYGAKQTYMPDDVIIL
ncbi:MAG: CRISPR-associated endonuclease Cas2 [Clostridia bacterium]|nr:CRISPR-associated endonuclease Cas2 [Clostridia bacterium]